MNTIEVLTQIIMPIITLVCGGGWFINRRQKKSLEKATANKAKIDATKDAVDLAEDIARKYAELVKSSMGDHDGRHDKLDESIGWIKDEIGFIGEYLNGDFVSFRKSKSKKR
ncbi:MAG: hypothetical protein LBU51_03145 [Bacteroidales bacterium]|jgi:hypothetical protein|nr:hypothetical protein [Bacteroidales bacterium]